MSAHASLPIVWKDSCEEPVYEKERINRIFNAIKPNRYPKAIVKASCQWHVQEAIKLASQLECRVSVRSGGHSWAVWSVRDDAILIDLAGLNEIELSEDGKVVKVSPSTTGAALNESLRPHGLMFGGGHCPDVGLGGFLLQGGMGWNCKV
jgi:FAD/FMN-containing dehydrogenase